MLHSQNSGKYLSKTWEHERERAMKNSLLFTQSELNYLEVQALGGEDGEGDRMRDTFSLDTSPIDPLSRPKRINMLNVQEKGRQ